MNLVCSLLVIFFVKRIFGDVVISTDSGLPFRQNITEPDLPHRQVYTTPEILLQRNYTKPPLPFQQSYTEPSIQFRRNYMGPNIPFQRNYTGPNIQFRENNMGPNIPFRQNNMGPNIPFRQNDMGPNIPFQRNSTGPQIPFQLNYTGPQRNDMQPPVLRDGRHHRRTKYPPRMRTAVTFKTLSLYKHVTDPIWEFEEIDYNFVFSRLYRQQHDCVGNNINCVLNRMFIRPICVANYYMKYHRNQGMTPKRMLSLCEMDFRNCQYRQSYDRHGGQWYRGVYGTGYHDDDLEITGEQEETTCWAYWWNKPNLQ